MDEHSISDDRASIAVGDRMQLRWGGTVAGGSVVAITGGKVRVRVVPGAELCVGRYDVRRLDRDGAAWGARCLGRPTADPGVVSLSCPDVWEPVPARHAARFRVDRASIVIESLQTGGKRRELVALDVSALGFSATAVGTPPPTGMTVRMTFDLGSYVERNWLHAVVVRSCPGSFGRYEIGLRFEPASQKERQRILAWRDAVATGTAPRSFSFG